MKVCVADLKFSLDKDCGEDPAYLFAFDELKGYAERIGKGQTVSENPVCVYLGKSCSFDFKAEHVKEDGFDVKIKDGGIYLIADTGKSAVYCVYDFLERFFGVKFLTADYVFVPAESGEVEIYEYFSDPDFDFRIFLTANVQQERFAPTQRVYSENFRISEKFGGGLRWNGKLGCNHSTLNFVPPSVYFTEKNKAENAHMYALTDGGKPYDICMCDGITEDGEADESMQVSAFKVALESLKKVLLENEDFRYISFGQMDSPDCCRCEKCVKAEKKIKRSGIVIRFANLLMKYVKRWMKENGIRREFYIVVFAYNYSTIAPVKRINGSSVPLIKADENVCVRIATIGTNCYFPFSSDMHFWPYKRICEEWKTVCKNLMIWTYHTNYKCYFWFFPTMQHWKEDLNLFYDLNVKYVFMQSDDREKNDWKADMECYCASKMLWDRSLDPYSLRNEFIDYVYGVAAGNIKEILNIFEKNYEKIARESVKKRKEFWKELFGDAERIPDEADTETVCKNLRKEADLEWTHNVYFNVYHKEISWVCVQPKELLEKQMDLLSESFDLINGSDYDLSRKTMIVNNLKRLKLTLYVMYIYNFDFYYPDRREKKEELKKEFFDLCDELGVKEMGEGLKSEDVKKNFDFRW